MRRASAGLGYLQYPIVILAVVAGLMLFVPFAVLAATSVSEARFLAFPPLGFSLDWYAQVIGDDDWLKPFGLTIMVATIASALALVAGTLGAVAITRVRPAVARGIRTLFIMPIVIPPISYAVGLYGLNRRIDLLEGSLVMLVVGEALIAVPYVFILVSTGVSRMDPALRAAASTLGAHWTLTLRTVELPVLMPNIVASAIFAFNIVFDEVVLSVFLTPPGSETFQVKLLTESGEALSPELTAASTLVSLLAIVLLAFLVFANRHVANYRLKGKNS